MTLIVGVFCDDGIVISADKQATHGMLGSTTVGHPVTKIHQIGDDGLFAASGPVGLTQQIKNVIETQYARLKRKNYSDSVAQFQNAVRQVLIPAFEMARVAGGVLGQGIASQEALCSALFAGNFSDGHNLVEISPQGMFESVKDGGGFSCQGSGKSNADPFIAHIWRIYWPDKFPTVREGTLAAYWTVKEVIASHTQGVGFAADVYLIERVEGSFKARQLSEAEYQEHDVLISTVEDRMKSVRDEMVATTNEEAKEDIDEIPRLKK